MAKLDIQQMTLKLFVMKIVLIFKKNFVNRLRRFEKNLRAGNTNKKFEINYTNLKQLNNLNKFN